MNVHTTVTNITADNVTVYVEGDYNPATLYHPKVAELHMGNNTIGALWNPTLEEIPTTLHAAVMQKKKIAIIYDGWIDYEHKEQVKPYGATREAEILGYDIYARLGEKYLYTHTDESGVLWHSYVTGGIYEHGDPVNYTWSVIQLYRAMGIEQVEYLVVTKAAGEDFDINASPLVQFLSMNTMGPDLSDALVDVYATRSDPDKYLALAETDLLGVPVAEDRANQFLSIADFCVLAQTLMELYGEPVITEQETYLLLEAYGRELPYGLPSRQLEAVKYLLARGIVENDLNWRENITFEEATTILMRIKDAASRLTFKEIQLTTDISLLSKGYYPTEVTSVQSPVEVIDAYSGYDTYTDYDYFVEVTEATRFRSGYGNYTAPFIGKGGDTSDGILEGTIYVGLEEIGGKTFYHFRASQALNSLGKDGVYINTTDSSDVPWRYYMSLPGEGNGGGYWLLQGDASTETVTGWKWYPLDGGTINFPAEYCDRARKEKSTSQYRTQLSLFSSSSYGFTIRVHTRDLADISFTKADGSQSYLSTVGYTAVQCANGITVKREVYATTVYQVFTVMGCNNASSLGEIFTCAKEGTAYQPFPSFAKNNEQYLVAVDYLKAIGTVWEFTRLSETGYYLGVKTADEEDIDTLYTDVFIGMAGSTSFVIRGTQMTVYPSDRPIVWETNNTYYVDYEAILGIQRVVAFADTDGSIQLSRGDQVPFLQSTQVYNVSRYSPLPTHTTFQYEYMQTVTVANEDDSDRAEYIYAPATYPLANWIVVDNQVDGRSGVFSFFANTDADSNSQGAIDLRSMLGVETTNTNWQVSYKDVPPLDLSAATVSDSGELLYPRKSPLPDILYVQSLNAYLIKPSDASGKTYGEWVQQAVSGEELLTSIVTTDHGLRDWNYDLCTVYGPDDIRYGWAVHWHKEGAHEVHCLCDTSSWNGDCYTDTFDPVYSRASVNVVAHAPVGIPGLLGCPYGTSYSLTEQDGARVYSGIAYLKSGGSGSATAYTSENGNVIAFAILHMTPRATWLQSCGFGFSFMEGSIIGDAVTSKPSLASGGATPGFDWEQFFHNIGIQNYDDWLTIAIITVLNILPRIFMFMFVMLMALSMIADVKPWRMFCDNVFDPYKLLTLGRHDVHTIQMKSVFLYSMIALALFGLFQNGLIIEIIAWIARAVVGILSR